MKRNHRKFISIQLILTVSILLSSVIVYADNIYVSSIFDGTIVKLDSSGNRTTFASGLDGPVGLAFDKNGNLYAACAASTTGTSTIEKFDPSGNRTTFASGLGALRGIEFDRNGNLYVSDKAANAILKFDHSGNQTIFASVTEPWYLAFDSSDFLYVSGNVMGWPYLNKVDTNGNVFLVSSDMADTWGLAVDRDDNLFVANMGLPSEEGNFDNSTIEKFDPSGNRTTFSILANYATDITFDNNGNLLAISSGSILKFDSSGNQTIFASGVSGSAWGIAVEPVPEPATLLLLGTGGLFLRRKK